MPADSAASPWADAAEGGADAPDYEALYAALAATPQGRWFLEQHADRSRHAVTTQVLTAIDRLKDEVAGAQPPAMPAGEPRSSGPGLDRFRVGLGGLAAALAAAQAELGKVEPPSTATEHQSILAATEALQEVAWFMRERGIESWLCDRLDGLSQAIRAVCAVPDLTAQRTRAMAEALAEVETRLDALKAGLDHDTEAEGLFAEPPVPAANANLPTSAPPVTVTLETKSLETAALETKALETGTPAEGATEEVATEEVAIAEPALPAAVESLVAEIAALSLVSGEFIVVETKDAAPAAADGVAKPDMSSSPAAEAAASEAETAPPGDVVSERPDVSRHASARPAADTMFADVERPPPTATELSSVEAEPREPADADWELPQPAADDPEQPQPSPRLSHLLMVAELDRLLATQAGSPESADPKPAPPDVEASIVAATIETGPAEAAPVEPASVEAPPLQAPSVDADAVELTVEAPFADTSESLPPTEVGAAASDKEPSPAPSVQRPVLNEPSELAKVDLAAFADVMALSDEERIALFT